MRLPEGPTSVISTSRTMSGSAPSTSRAGLTPIGTLSNTIDRSDNSWRQLHVQEPRASITFERIERLSIFRRERWQSVLVEINQQRWSNIYWKTRSKEGNRYQLSESRYMVRTSSRLTMTDCEREYQKKVIKERLSREKSKAEDAASRLGEP